MVYIKSSLVREQHTNRYAVIELDDMGTLRRGNQLTRWWGKDLRRFPGKIWPELRT